MSIPLYFRFFLFLSIFPFSFSLFLCISLFFLKKNLLLLRPSPFKWVFSRFHVFHFTYFIPPHFFSRINFFCPCFFLFFDSDLFPFFLLIMYTAKFPPLFFLEGFSFLFFLYLSSSFQLSTFHFIYLSLSISPFPSLFSSPHYSTAFVDVFFFFLSHIPKHVRPLLLF